jgi:ribose transport system substrate-binding protein
MKKVVGVFLLVIMIISTLVGCGNQVSSESSNSDTAQSGESVAGTLNEDSTQTEDSQTEDSEITIALIMKTLSNPFFIEMEKGARKAETELGINLIVKTGANETSIEEQIAIVEEMIELGVTGIVIAPGSSTELIPSLKKAQDAGIIIVNIDNKLDTELSEEAGLIGVPFISVDNEEGGYLCGKYLSELITTPTQVAILEGIRGADNAEQRKNGALRAFAENSNIEVVASETANWKIDEALTVITEIYTNNPEVGAIFCANDMMALGVVEYMKENNKSDVLIGGYDALEEAIAAIQEGTMKVTINQQADVQGYTGVQYAIDMINGKEVPMETLIDVEVIDNTSVE